MYSARTAYGYCLKLGSMAVLYTSGGQTIGNNVFVLNDYHA